MLNSLVRLVASRSFYVALLSAAVLVNAAGYLFNLWHDETIFDEAVHFYTSFAVVAALGRLAVEKDWLPSGASRWLALPALGMIMGLAWEAFEYMIGIIGSRHDTLMDLAMDGAGALLATALIDRVSGRIPKVR